MALKMANECIAKVEANKPARLNNISKTELVLEEFRYMNAKEWTRRRRKHEKAL
jgi:hypothetical protein